LVCSSLRTRVCLRLYSATREQVYQDKENERVRVQAAEVQRSMRRYLLEGKDGEQIAA
jgi:hypothetical protein